MKDTRSDEIDEFTVDYEILDNSLKRADQIRLPVSVLSKLIRKKRQHIKREHVIRMNYLYR